MKILDQEFGNNWAAYNGDCVEVCRGLHPNSIHYILFSPPFASLYTYSDSDRDMGNSKDDAVFSRHFGFLTEQLFRVLKPGRLCSIHCMDIPAMKERDGYIGLKDFPGDILRAMQRVGFIYHSRVAIWKDPLIEATRTKALGLMHKQIEKDSAMCRNGLPDYIITVRKPGDNDDPIAHPGGFGCFIGDNEPKQTGVEYSHNVWRRYASPIWMDINQTRTLNVIMARDERDERHICPLQLDTIARCVHLWTNERDVVLSPFAGIMSEGYESLKMGRRFVGVELKRSYFEEGVRNLLSVENGAKQLELFG